MEAAPRLRPRWQEGTCLGKEWLSHTGLMLHVWGLAPATACQVSSVRPGLLVVRRGCHVQCVPPAAGYTGTRHPTPIHVAEVFTGATRTRGAPGCYGISNKRVGAVLPGFSREGVAVSGLSLRRYGQPLGSSPLTRLRAGGQGHQL